MISPWLNIVYSESESRSLVWFGLGWLLYYVNFILGGGGGNIISGASLFEIYDVDS